MTNGISIYGSAPLDLTSLGWTAPPFNPNSFSESAGVVTGATLAYWSPDLDSALVLDGFVLTAGTDTLFLDDRRANWVLNDGGFAAITFPPQGPSVPEPETWAMLAAASSDWHGSHFGVVRNAANGPAGIPELNQANGNSTRTPPTTHRFQRRTYCPMRCRISSGGASCS